MCSGEGAMDVLKEATKDTKKSALVAVRRNLSHVPGPVGRAGRSEGIHQFLDFLVIMHFGRVETVDMTI